MAKNDGGPAYPGSYTTSDFYGRKTVHVTDGMSLRDAAALAAFPAAIQLAMQFNCKEASPMPQAARFAFEAADAFLAARSSEEEASR